MLSFRKNVSVSFLFIWIIGANQCAWSKIQPDLQKTGWESFDHHWTRHTIDDSSEGADGVKLGDFNGDGKLDIATGWEEGGVVRMYLHPGVDDVDDLWPVVELGHVTDVEDAVFMDVNDDGLLDVVSLTEGDTRSIYFHVAPEKDLAMQASNWRTTRLPAAHNKMRWMFAIPVDVDGENGVDIVAAGKDDNAELGWFESPKAPAEPGRWQWHSWAPVSWVMSILQYDLNEDDREDILYSDRKQSARGVYWIEKNDDTAQSPYNSPVYIGGRSHELMFMAIDDANNDGSEDIAVATRDTRLVLLERAQDNSWVESTIDFPDETGTGKGVAIGDLDADGNNEIVVTCENAQGKAGVFYLKFESETGKWAAVNISGPEGIKFDRIELLDVDDDGDLDVLTCEESEGLGVIWYENPQY